MIWMARRRTRTIVQVFLIDAVDEPEARTKLVDYRQQLQSPKIDTDKLKIVKLFGEKDKPVTHINTFFPIERE